MAKRDTNTKAEGGNGIQYHINIPSNTQCNGYVATVNGYVIVHSIHWHDSGDANTILQLIHGGRLHTRYEDKFYLPRPLVTAAKEFAAEIAAKGQSK